MILWLKIYFNFRLHNNREKVRFLEFYPSNSLNSFFNILTVLNHKRTVRPVVGKKYYQNRLRRLFLKEIKNYLLSFLTKIGVYFKNFSK